MHETGYQPKQGHYPSFSAYKMWLEGKHYSHILVFRSRVGGAIDELDRIVRHFDEDSGRSGYDRPGALALMGRNQEQLIRDQATRMSDTIERLAKLRAQQSAMNQPARSPASPRSARRSDA